MDGWEVYILCALVFIIVIITTSKSGTRKTISIPPKENKLLKSKESDEASFTDEDLENRNNQIRYINHSNFYANKLPIIHKGQKYTDQELYEIVKKIESSLKRHTIIINDNLRTISKTNDLNELFNTFDSINSNITTFQSYIDKNNIPLKDYDPKFLEKLDANFNFNLIRILEYIYEEYINKVDSLVTLKGINKYFYSVVMKCYDISRHIRSASNNDETLSEYNRIYNEIYNIYRSYILNIEKNEIYTENDDVIYLLRSDFREYGIRPDGIFGTSFYHDEGLFKITFKDHVLVSRKTEYEKQIHLDRLIKIKESK
ncbi:hypothetical protein CMU01_17405 [Elizabethkingia anophelis]|nr:hypothetical protein [Elizabethkingia anophelis]MCT4101669.1 hypothetical protein [Elizabethkingia anophelis]MCT4166069.1 hypothetical protein [Elizabethkingia anophelis]MDV3877801.1 hypothetical protein [Elizabethkingia anophelis]HAY3540839.1 hypothetical protein [Elizabethkingia anophelis]